MFGDNSAFSVAQYGIEEMKDRLVRDCDRKFKTMSVGQVMDVQCPVKSLADAIREIYSGKNQMVRFKKNADRTYEVAVVKIGGNPNA